MRVSVFALALVGVAQAAPVTSEVENRRVSAGDFGAATIIQKLDNYFERFPDVNLMRGFYNTYIWKAPSSMYTGVPGSPAYVAPVPGVPHSNPDLQTVSSLAAAINNKNKPLIKAYLAMKIIGAMKGETADTTQTASSRGGLTTTKGAKSAKNGKDTKSTKAKAAKWAKAKTKSHKNANGMTTFQTIESLVNPAVLQPGPDGKLQGMAAKHDGRRKKYLEAEIQTLKKMNDDLELDDELE